MKAPDLEYYGPGRPPLPETMARMKKMVNLIQKEPGVKSAKLAKALGITSLECSALARRLAKRNILTIGKVDRSLVYTVNQEAA